MSLERAISEVEMNIPRTICLLWGHDWEVANSPHENYDVMKICSRCGCVKRVKRLKS